MYREFEKCLKLSSKERKRLNNFFLSSSIDVQATYINMQFKIYRKIEKTNFNNDILYLCAFYRSLMHEQDKIVGIDRDMLAEFFEKFDIKKLVAFFAKQDVVVQINIFKEQRNQFFKYEKKVHANHLPLYAFLCAISIYYQKFKLKFYKNKTFDIKSQSSLVDVNILKDKKQKICIKRERFLNYISVSKRLREEGYSYRKMSAHFQKYYKYNVSHTYLRKMCKEFLKEVNVI